MTEQKNYDTLYIDLCLQNFADTIGAYLRRIQPSDMQIAAQAACMEELDENS